MIDTMIAELPEALRAGVAHPADTHPEEYARMTKPERIAYFEQMAAGYARLAKTHRERLQDPNVNRRSAAAAARLRASIKASAAAAELTARIFEHYAATA